MRGSGQRLPITLRFTRVLGTFSHTTCFPFSCALWACFSDRSVSGERSEPMGALMPHAALFVVQQVTVTPTSRRSSSFNAARGFVCGAARSARFRTQDLGVSMPHAALWVMQPERSTPRTWMLPSFNAARGYSLSPPPPLRGPPPPLAQGRLGYAPFSRRITQYQLPPPVRGKWRAQQADGGAHAARGFVGGAAIDPRLCG